MLLLASIVLAAPALTGGARFYMDNPVHLAEIDSIARALASSASAGWCDDAFCGFPLLTTQSPLWYGLLGLLARAGIPPLLPYTLLVWLAFAAPSLALYRVARHALPRFAAGCLAFLLLVQRPALSGFESALSGLWTWHLALAGVILLVHRLAPPGRSARTAAATAALAAIIGLTHLMALVTAGGVFFISIIFHARYRRWRDAAADAASALVALLASSAFWLPYLLGSTGAVVARHDLGFMSIVRLLLLPVDVSMLSAQAGLHYTDALPMVALFVLGLAGCTRLLRQREATGPERSAAAYGAALAAVFLLILALPGRMPDLLTGPISWRYLHVARIGLALAAIPAVAAIATRHPPTPSRRHALTVLALASCFWWVLPLQRSVPRAGSLELQQVESLWRWLRDARANETGRVVLQDTFGGGTGRLRYSHALALTRAHTGLRQVGAWYGAVPFRTFRWTQSEFEGVLGVPERGFEEPSYVAELVRRMRASNGRLLVVTDTPRSQRLAVRPEFAVVRRAGNFLVLEATGVHASWVTPLSAGVAAEVISYDDGRVQFAADSDTAGGSVRVHAAWHPFWRIECDDGVRMGPDEDGLIVVSGLPAGASRVELAWRQPRFPVILSGIGWLVITASALRRRRSAPSSRWAHAA